MERNGRQCEEIIYSNDYSDYILEYSSGIEMLKEMYKPDCLQNINNRFYIIHQRMVGNPMVTLDQYGYTTIPKCFGLLDTSSMEAAGILRLRRQPYLNLTGSGVLIGFIDTGIDYTNPLFKNADNTSRIAAIWDQTDRDGNPPTGFYYGTEYTQQQIEEALAAEDPFSVVPQRDEDGHGTFLAGLAAGNDDPENQFTGAAPQSQIAVVKLKEAKQHLRDYYCIQEGVPAYSEVDIMTAVRYLISIAFQLRQPIVINIGIGSSAGNHSGVISISRYLNSVSATIGTALVAAAGNEGNRGHHYSSGIIASETSEDVEFRVAENENGVYMELWASAPNLFSVGFVSPLGEFTGIIPLWYKDGRAITFPLENSQIYIHYTVVESYTGDQVVVMQLITPTPGIWRLRVFNERSNSASFNVWMGMERFLKEETFFLNPDPDMTVCEPGNALNVLTMTAYDHTTESIYTNASRGYTSTNDIKPELAAPGVNVYGPVANNRFGQKSGTSVAGAITSGAAALMLEWGVLKGNSATMQTTEIENYFIRGARRRNMDYPNRIWGYGELDLYGVFESMRLS